MSQDHANPSQNQDKNQDYDEQKIEKARARKHKVSGVQFFYIFLLLAAVCIAIYIIEFYR